MEIQTINRKSVVLLLLCITVIVNAPNHLAHAQEPGPLPTGDPSIAVKFRTQIDVPEYGGNIDVYDNVPALVPNGGQPAPGFHQQHFYLPLPVLDLSRAKQDFAKLNWSTNLQETQSLKLHFTFLSRLVEQTIAAALTAESNGSPVSTADVVPVPANEFDVYAEIDDQYVLVWNEPKLTDPAFSNTHSTYRPYTIENAELTATKAQMEEFLATPSVLSRGIVMAADVSSELITVAGQALLGDEFQNSVVGNGGFSTTTTFSSGESGVGVSVPYLGATSSSQSDTAQSSVQRYVSRRFVMNALQNSSVTIGLTTFHDLHPGQGDVNSDVQMLLQYALNAMPQALAKFRENADGKYQMFTGPTFSDAIGEGMSLSDITANSQLSDKLDADLQQKLTNGQLTAQDEEKLNRQANGDINWKVEGHVLVPSTVNLYIYQTQEFRHKLNVTLLDNAATYSQHSFSAGPFVATDGSVLSDDKQNVTIGEIVSSVVPWAQASPWFQQHWLPADGRTVGPDTLYFKEMAPRTPGGEPDLSATVNVPDLRGEFLRGLNDFGAGMSPSSRDPLGTRTAGVTEEMDAVQKAEYETVKNDQNASLLHWRAGGDAGGGDHFSPRSPGGPNTQTDPSDGTVSHIVFMGRTDSETRPRNIAVYYYIRVN